MEAYLIAIGTISLIYMLLALGLNLQYGHIGLVNFGYVAFFAIGAYTSGLLSLHGWSVGLTFIPAMILSAVAAYPIGLLSLRLSEDYFAIVTLGFAEAVKVMLEQESWLTNGVQGLAGIPKLFQNAGNNADVYTVLLLAICNAVAVVILAHLIRSPYGRLIRAIRDDEVAVHSLGKDPARFKTEIFMLGSALAGLAGSFYAHFITYLSPGQFTALETFYVWIAMIIGGVGSTPGVMLGSIVLMGLLEGSSFLNELIPGLGGTEMSSLRLGAIGLALIVFTLYRPEGLLRLARSR